MLPFNCTGPSTLASPRKKASVQAGSCLHESPRNPVYSALTEGSTAGSAVPTALSLSSHASAFPFPFPGCVPLATCALTHALKRIGLARGVSLECGAVVKLVPLPDNGCRASYGSVHAVSWCPSGKRTVVCNDGHAASLRQVQRRQLLALLSAGPSPSVQAPALRQWSSLSTCTLGAGARGKGVMLRPASPPHIMCNKLPYSLCTGEYALRGGWTMEGCHHKLAICSRSVRHTRKRSLCRRGAGMPGMHLAGRPGGAQSTR